MVTVKHLYFKTKCKCELGINYYKTYEVLARLTLSIIFIVPIFVYLTLLFVFIINISTSNNSVNNMTTSD